MYSCYPGLSKTCKKGLNVQKTVFMDVRINKKGRNLIEQHDLNLEHLVLMLHNNSGQRFTLTRSIKDDSWPQRTSVHIEYLFSGEKATRMKIHQVENRDQMWTMSRRVATVTIQRPFH